MNKQELIERYESYEGIWVSPGAEAARICFLRDLKQLEELPSGHAEEAPRYVKNVLARLRELPLHDREVWLKAIMSEFEQDFSHAKWREGYEQGKFEGMIESEKVKIPQFVADWIEARKENLAIGLYIAMNPDFIKQWNKSDKLISWVRKINNQNLFARAWLDGYEVEREKQYKVVMPNISSTGGVLTRIKHNDSWIWIDTLGTIVEGRTHTRKELEEAGFGWVFDCPGIDIEEVNR
jgi:hypothetical protein